MKNKNWVGYAFISPWLIGFAVFTAVPFLVSVYLSFTRYDVVSSPVWVGAANYHRLIAEDALFWKSLWITLRFALVSVPLGIVLGVTLALLLNLRVRGIAIYRTVFFIPSIVPLVATTAIFCWILNPQFGVVNVLLKVVGLTGPAWLQSTRWAFWSLVVLSMWTVGGSMIIYLAGLKDVPVSLYEAALIDGAGPWHRLRHVTLPMITPVIFFNLVMGVIGSFQYFTQAYILTMGGPDDSTHFYALYLFNRAWRYLDMGYASAMAWILFIVVMVFTGLIFRTHRRWVHYGE